MMKNIGNEFLRKGFCWICILCYALAAIGGIAYLIVYQHGIFAIAAVGTTAMATPYLIERINELMQ